MIRITFIGEDHWSAHLAEGLNSRFPDEVRCVAIRLQDSFLAIPQIILHLLCDEVFVRVGFPPTALIHEEYDEMRYIHRTGRKEQLKRRLFRTAFGRALRRIVLLVRSGSAWRRRVFAEWLQYQGLRRAGRHKDFLYWIGSDVPAVLNRYRDCTLNPKCIAKMKSMRNLTGERRLTEELAGIGILARTAPFPGGLACSPEHETTMPNEMSVLTYIPDSRRDFYGWNEIRAAAQQLEDLRFVVMGGSGESLRNVPPNVEFVGHVDDPRPLFDACSVVIRHVEHDGAGGTMIEGLLHTRQVIYTYAIPYVIHVRFGDSEGLTLALEDLRRTHLAGGIPLNSAGRDWALQEYNVDRRFQYLYELLTSDDPISSSTGVAP